MERGGLPTPHLRRPVRLMSASLRRFFVDRTVRARMWDYVVWLCQECMEADSVQQRMPASQQTPRCNRDDGRLRQQWAILMLAGNRPVSRRIPVSTQGQWEFGLRVRNGRPWDLKREQRNAGFRRWNRRGFRPRTPGTDAGPGYWDRGFRARLSCNCANPAGSSPLQETNGL